MSKPDFGDLEEQSDEENMSESDWHMQQAIEASMRGGNVNPTIEEEMFGGPSSQPQAPRVRPLHQTP